MADVESLIGQVWSPDVRPLAEEAWRCYNAGATRACITMTWSAVTADIITKLVRLADDGDGQAVSFRTTLTEAQKKGLTKEGVRAMQAIEASLLEKAVEFELIDSIGSRELERIREDRNLCAHPSLRMLGDVYEPRPEVARGHVAVALTTLLTHPPTLGRKVLDEFSAYICDPFFVPTHPHMQATFFDRVRTATRKTIIGFAAKHALLELDPDGRMPAAEHADRMALALIAFAQRDRELVRTAVAAQSERFQVLEGVAQLRALARLGDQDFFWSMVDQALATRLQEMVNRLSATAEWDPLPATTAAALALVRSQYARDRLPGLETRFTTLAWKHRLGVATVRPDPYFIPAVLRLIQEAGSWRSGEQAGRVLVQHAPFLTIDTLRDVMSKWCDNSECRQAAEMPGLAVLLFQGTSHLGQARAAVFGEFLTSVRAIEGEGEYYSYPALEEALLHTG
ncbi:hypothetical protein [Nonomuraea ferruginea]|uniref:Uncharacterized protein n=1 Tax=Nonomuraea ferruginea TaxID=46174 RepID=A0ABT4SRD5_9ACTN|nr:hypothetical protein [Nonomuraea ferruginea]MDA0639804.1 hypothetical protein [Nonomuraea ferruginea]